MKKLTTRARGFIFTVVGACAALSALLPRADLEAPPILMIHPHSANTAELLTLPGIGPARARLIVERQALDTPLRSGEEIRKAVKLPRRWLARVAPFLTETHACTGKARGNHELR